jgi:hypothetical protein
MLAAVLEVILKNDGLGIFYYPNLRPFIIDSVFNDAGLTCSRINATP